MQLSNAVVFWNHDVKIWNDFLNIYAVSSYLWGRHCSSKGEKSNFSKKSQNESVSLSPITDAPTSEQLYWLAAILLPRPGKTLKEYTLSLMTQKSRFISEILGASDHKMYDKMQNQK